MITINLLPWRERYQRTERRTWRLMLSFGVIVLLSLFGLCYSALDREAMEVERLLDEAAKMELGDVEEPKASQSSWERLKHATEKIRQVQLANQSSYQLLCRLLTELPDVVKLIAFNWRAGQFSIEGVVQDETMLQYVVDWLRTYQYRIKSIKSKRQATQVLSFKIEAK